MNIKKKDGSLQEFDPSKILTRLRVQSKGLNVDFTAIAIQVQSLLYEGITSAEIDMESARIAASYIANHNDYNTLAARLVVSRLHKSLSSNWEDRIGKFASADILEKQSMWKISFDKDSDYLLDYGGIQTFINLYGLKDEEVLVELPCEMYLRVALFLSDSKKECEELYHAICHKYLSLATPVILNAGTNNSQMISCSLNMLQDDSLDGIHDTKREISKQSSRAAGIGLYAGNLRSQHTSYRNKGKAGGLTRFAKGINEDLRFFKQSSTRRGAAALYVDLWHRDVMEMLNWRKQETSEELAARDLFPAIVMNDLFYKRLLADENSKWSFFCPHLVQKEFDFNLYDCWGEEFEMRYAACEESNIPRTEMTCKQIITEICDAQAKTGTPYLWNKDTVNRSYNQSNYGVSKASNLCVTPDTQILTDFGYFCIGDLEGQQVNVWNGKQFSQAIVTKTNVNQETLKVITDSGYELNCTPYHKFYIQEGFSRSKITVKRAHELKEGDRLIKFDLPTIEGIEELLYAYDNGYYSGDGCLTKGNQKLYLYGEKQELEPFLTSVGKWYVDESQNRTYGYTKLLKDKFFVPGAEYTIEARLNWLAGYMDADGTLCNNQGSLSVQIGSVEKEFLKEVQLMLQTLGVDSKITMSREEGSYKLPANDGTGLNKMFDCKEVNRLLINGNSLWKLIQLGLKCNRLKLVENKPNRECSKFIKIKEVIKNDYLSDTYCFNEPLEHKGMFNGILTGNCIEIINYFSPDRSGQCALASIPVHNCAGNSELLQKATALAVRVLNKLVDVNDYSTDAARLAGFEQRSLGIGIAGLQELALELDLPFTSREFLSVSNEVSELMYYAAVKESMLLAKEEVKQLEGQVIRPEYHRKHPMIQQTPLAKGVFHFELCGKQSEYVSKEQWEELRQDILTYGIVNSLLIAHMPTATTSMILACTEGSECLQELVQVRRTGSGEFISVNKYLQKDLEALGIWSKQLCEDIISKESLKDIDFMSYFKSNNIGLELEAEIRKFLNRTDYLKTKYKTIWEISMKDYINLAAGRQPFIDQSQSMNLYYPEGILANMVSAQVYAWKSGLKTGVYYTKVKKQTKADKKLSFNFVEKKEKPVNSQYICDNCSV